LGTFFELPNAVSFSALLDKENRLLEFGFCDESNFFLSGLAGSTTALAN